MHLTRFIGRDRELSELDQLLADTRLLTLTGAGGSGKTRLAREVAVRTPRTYDRLGWVDLAPVATGDLVAQQIASALHVHERPGMSPIDLLIDALRPDRALIVFDNCEHVIDATAALVESLLRACPRLTIVATSREALGVASETAWLVPPLVGDDAVQLFAERARQAVPTFAVATNRAAITEICRRVDGIPLAIELAAARVRVLSPEQIAARLDDAFHLLSAGNRTALPRHRTLRATMECAHRVLPGRERSRLCRLRGGDPASAHHGRRHQHGDRAVEVWRGTAARRRDRRVGEHSRRGGRVHSGHAAGRHYAHLRTVLARLGGVCAGRHRHGGRARGARAGDRP